MRWTPVIVVVALGTSGCLASGSGGDEPAPVRAGHACDRPIPERVEVPERTGTVPIGDGAVWVANAGACVLTRLAP